MAEVQRTDWHVMTGSSHVYSMFSISSLLQIFQVLDSWRQVECMSGASPAVKVVSSQRDGSMPSIRMLPDSDAFP